MIKCKKSIGKQLGIFSKFESYGSITPAHKAWITIKAKKQGLSPKMVHAGIKAHYARIENYGDIRD
jgi:hypothetical protein